MLARRHIAIGGGDDPRFMYLNGKFVEIGEDGSMVFTSDAGVDLNNISSYGMVAYGEVNELEDYIGLSINGNNATLAILRLDRAEVLLDNVQLQLSGVEDLTGTLKGRIRYDGATGTARFVSGSAYYSLSWRQIPNQTTYEFLDINKYSPLGYTASVYDAGGGEQYVCDTSNDEIKIYDNITNLTVTASFSTATELANSPEFCVYNDDDDVLYVIDDLGNLCAYDVSSGNEGTSLGTISLSSFSVTTAFGGNSYLNIKHDTDKDVLLITTGTAIHVVDVSDPASMTETRIGSGASLVGGTMVVNPISVDIKYDTLFIFSGHTDSETDVLAISVDYSTGLTASSEVLGSLTGEDIGHDDAESYLGYGKVY